MAAARIALASFGQVRMAVMAAVSRTCSGISRRDTITYTPPSRAPRLPGSLKSSDERLVEVQHLFYLLGHPGSSSSSSNRSRTPVATTILARDAGLGS